MGLLDRLFRRTAASDAAVQRVGDEFAPSGSDDSTLGPSNSANVEDVVGGLEPNEVIPKAATFAPPAWSILPPIHTQSAAGIHRTFDSQVQHTLRSTRAADALLLRKPMEHVVNPESSGVIHGMLSPSLNTSPAAAAYGSGLDAVLRRKVLRDAEELVATDRSHRRWPILAAAQALPTPAATAAPVAQRSATEPLPVFIESPADSPGEHATPADTPNNVLGTDSTITNSATSANGESANVTSSVSSSTRELPVVEPPRISSVPAVSRVTDPAGVMRTAVGLNGAPLVLRAVEVERSPDGGRGRQRASSLGLDDAANAVPASPSISAPTSISNQSGLTNELPTADRPQPSDIATVPVPTISTSPNTTALHRIADESPSVVRANLPTEASPQTPSPTIRRRWVSEVTAPTQSVQSVHRDADGESTNDPQSASHESNPQSQFEPAVRRIGLGEPMQSLPTTAKSIDRVFDESVDHGNPFDGYFDTGQDEPSLLTSAAGVNTVEAVPVVRDTTAGSLQRLADDPVGILASQDLAAANSQPASVDSVAALPALEVLRAGSTVVGGVQREADSAGELDSPQAATSLPLLGDRPLVPSLQSDESLAVTTERASTGDDGSNGSGRSSFGGEPVSSLTGLTSPVVVPLQRTISRATDVNVASPSNALGIRRASFDMSGSSSDTTVRADPAIVSRVSDPQLTFPGPRAAAPNAPQANNDVSVAPAGSSLGPVTLGRVVARDADHGAAFVPSVRSAVTEPFGANVVSRSEELQSASLSYDNKFGRGQMSPSNTWSYSESETGSAGAAQQVDRRVETEIYRAADSSASEPAIAAMGQESPDAIASAGASAGAGPSSAQTESDLDALAGRLYDRLRFRLKRELLDDRERVGLVLDRIR